MSEKKYDFCAAWDDIDDFIDGKSVANLDQKRRIVFEALEKLKYLEDLVNKDVIYYNLLKNSFHLWCDENEIEEDMHCFILWMIRVHLPAIFYEE